MSVIHIPRILLPARSDPDSMRKWSVIACDQFTSDENYWKQTEAETGGAPSAFNLIYPEVYLNAADGEERIAAIHRNMRAYLKGGVFRLLDRGFVLVERTTRFSPHKRYGVVLAIDLEEYSFSAQSGAKIRATEATVSERIPPRVKIRRGAALELPHVMLLYDAPEARISDGIDVGSLQPLYDFELNRGGGHLRGWFLPEAAARKITENLYAAATGEILFAVGDGNHSLAAAKTCWEEIKKGLTPEEQRTHPARYALCEAVSLYSPALTFEPIHRFLCGVDVEKAIAALKDSLPMPVLREGNVLSFTAGDPVETLRRVDDFIAGYTGAHGGSVDYVHGEAELRKLVSAGCGRVGVILKTVEKDGFFKAVESGGALPRKTFSMGEGTEKRYYTECKIIDREIDKGIYPEGKER